jgi:hypothetical protein
MYTYHYRVSYYLKFAPQTSCIWHILQQVLKSTGYVALVCKAANKIWSQFFSSFRVQKINEFLVPSTKLTNNFVGLVTSCQMDQTDLHNKIPVGFWFSTYHIINIRSWVIITESLLGVLHNWSVIQWEVLFRKQYYYNTGTISNFDELWMF